ncbi:hypothetical protein ACFYNO_03285 [Kitasatospora sp. NPDC006697]|uniref:hypothetical protein n=1 Tax=Kitasatospora sp. NPDC006697 TaxID=3364020 RepID=UPI00368608A6
MSVEAEPAWLDVRVGSGSGRSPAGEARPWVQLVVGAAAMTLGGWYGAAYAEAWVHFHGAARADAVVVGVDYAKTASRESPNGFTVEVAGRDGRPVRASVDDPATGPSGVSVGAREVVLVDFGRPGHVLFPSQLHWTAAALPALGVTFGVVVAGMGAFELATRRAGGAWDSGRRAIRR